MSGLCSQLVYTAPKWQKKNQIKIKKNQTAALMNIIHPFHDEKHHQTHLMQLRIMFIHIIRHIFPYCTLLCCSSREGRRGLMAKHGVMSAGRTVICSQLWYSGTSLVPLWCYKVMLKHNTSVVYHDGLYQSQQQCLCKLLSNWF